MTAVRWLSTLSAAYALQADRAVLRKSIKLPDPVPAEGIAAAVECMESGSLFRYNVKDSDASQVSQCEAEFAEYTGFKFALGLNSCGSAIFLSLKCAGAQFGDLVLTNGFTFTAVPSAIVHAGCEPVYVECTDGLVVDVDDLRIKMDATPSAKYFVVSHMRGKLAEMDAVAALCKERGVVLLEDCAHSLGVLWNGEHSGHHGKIAAFSSQSYKLLNSGEGGFFATDDDDAMATAMAYAGAYEVLAKKHVVVPSQAALDKVMDGSIPNFSLRMHEATAAMLRPQIKTVDQRRSEYNRRYYKVAAMLDALPGVSVPKQLDQVTIVGDSVQFHVTRDTFASHDADASAVSKGTDDFLARCLERGLPVELFGSKTNARNFVNWRYAKQPQCGLPKTAEIISRAFDVRLPLRFEDADFDTIVAIVTEALVETRNTHGALSKVPAAAKVAADVGA
ncbi:pyridoxal phosphate-dependent transferase [Pelagophyceae sp. CCMP2097]|nr:pyridoxal phosphate-dependent transferase [Pelagophyceae sp. CCMP2097]